MNLQHQYLVAEHIGTRHHEAEQQRRTHLVARSRRLARRADRLAHQARLAANRLL